MAPPPLRSGGANGGIDEDEDEFDLLFDDQALLDPELEESLAQAEATYTASQAVQPAAPCCLLVPPSTPIPPLALPTAEAPSYLPLQRSRASIRVPPGSATRIAPQNPHCWPNRVRTRSSSATSEKMKTLGTRTTISGGQPTMRSTRSKKKPSACLSTCPLRNPTAPIATPTHEMQDQIQTRRGVPRPAKQHKPHPRSRQIQAAVCQATTHPQTSKPTSSISFEPRSSDSAPHSAPGRDGGQAQAGCLPQGWRGGRRASEPHQAQPGKRQAARARGAARARASRLARTAPKGPGETPAAPRDRDRLPQSRTGHQPSHLALERGSSAPVGLRDMDRRQESQVRAGLTTPTKPTDTGYAAVEAQATVNDS